MLLRVAGQFGAKLIPPAFAGILRFSREVQTVRAVFWPLSERGLRARVGGWG